eukprot:jgi/Botrbrau1/8279/Bobra.0251s0008.1
MRNLFGCFRRGKRQPSGQFKVQRRQEKAREDLKKAQESSATPRNLPRASQPSAEGSPLSLEPLPDEEMVDKLADRHMDDEEALCAVCGEGHSVEPNVIVFCERCEVGVHQDCYGIALVPEGDWLCWPCLKYEEEQQAAGVPKDEIRPPRWRRVKINEGGALSTTCLLCPVKRGAFRQAVNSRTWVHQVCAMWHPETRVQASGACAVVEGITDVKRERWELPCAVCRRKQGAVVRCSSPRCSNAFHPLCGRNNGRYYLAVREAGPRLVYQAYCPIHAPEERAKDLAANGGNAGRARSRNKAADLKELQGASLQREMLRRVRLDMELLRILLDLVHRREKLKRAELRAWSTVWKARFGDPVRAIELQEHPEQILEAQRAAAAARPDPAGGYESLVGLRGGPGGGRRISTSPGTPELSTDSEPQAPSRNRTGRGGRRRGTATRPSRGRARRIGSARPGDLPLETWHHISPEDAAVLNAAFKNVDVTKAYTFITRDEYLAIQLKKEQETGVRRHISQPPQVPGVPAPPGGGGVRSEPPVAGPQEGTAGYKGVPQGVGAALSQPQQELQHLALPEGAEQGLDQEMLPDEIGLMLDALAPP